MRRTVSPMIATLALVLFAVAAIGTAEACPYSAKGQTVKAPESVSTAMNPQTTAPIVAPGKDG